MPATAPTSVPPKLTAEQVLTHLLGVIRDSKDTREITSEQLGSQMGVEFLSEEPGYHVFGEELTPGWGYGMELYDSITPARSHRLLFSFNGDPGADSGVAGLCKLDFSQFTAELEQMGFVRVGHYGSPPQPPPGVPRLPRGSWMYDHFDRPGMHIEVHPQWTIPSSLGEAGRECVRMILIS